MIGKAIGLERLSGKCNVSTYKQAKTN